MLEHWTEILLSQTLDIIHLWVNNRKTDFYNDFILLGAEIQRLREFINFNIYVNLGL